MTRTNRSFDLVHEYPLYVTLCFALSLFVITPFEIERLAPIEFTNTDNLQFNSRTAYRYIHTETKAFTQP